MGAAPLKRRTLLVAGAAALMAGPALSEPFRHTKAPRTTHIVVSKSKRVLELRVGRDVIRRYRIDLGFQPEGHKLVSGDGRTPEGRYWIDRRNPRSEYFLSLGISYPNARDVARARSIGKHPGGDIFIHGEPVRPREIAAARGKKDWTAGCIAVTNAEIEEIWALTPTGVPITILA